MTPAPLRSHKRKGGAKSLASGWVAVEDGAPVANVMESLAAQGADTFHGNWRPVASIRGAL
jgi:hypothetical protein